jgi:NADH-quinone oxidoreductase subunit M
MLYERAHTRYIPSFGGVAKLMPVYAAFFLVVMFSSAGLPGTNGFVGEFLILVGTFRQAALGLQPYAIVAGAGVVLGALYLLWMYQRVMQGPVRVPVAASNDPGSQEHAMHLSDIKAREIAMLVPIVVLILWIGIYPKPFLDRTATSINQVGQQVAAANNTLLAGGR